MANRHAQYTVTLYNEAASGSASDLRAIIAQHLLRGEGDVDVEQTVALTFGPVQR